MGRHVRLLGILVWLWGALGALVGVSMLLLGAGAFALSAGRDGFGSNPKFAALIAERGGAPVGFALYTFNYSVWTAARGIFIEDIWVVPEERRGGVARALMAALAGECAAKGFKRIDLNVLDWNPARGFYERLGFRWIRNWLPYRLSGEPLAALARSSSTGS